MTNEAQRQQKPAVTQLHQTHSGAAPEDRSFNIPSAKFASFVYRPKSNSVEGKNQQSDSEPGPMPCCLSSSEHTHTYRFSSPLETHQIETTVVINLRHKP